MRDDGTPRPGYRHGPWIALALAGVLVAISPSCATEEDLQFGDPARVAVGVGVSSGSTTGGCAPDPSCSVSFRDDVFGPILDEKAKCTAETCHGGGTAGLTMIVGDSDGAYAALTNYKLSGGRGDYIVPCDLAASKLLCNFKLGPDEGANPYDTCGSLMPKVLLADAVDDEPLTAEDLATVAMWIECGAPPN
jgi:hypothetical protein